MLKGFITEIKKIFCFHVWQVSIEVFNQERNSWGKWVHIYKRECIKCRKSKYYLGKRNIPK